MLLFNNKNTFEENFVDMKNLNKIFYLLYHLLEQFYYYAENSTKPKLLILFIVTLQAPFLYTGQESYDFDPDFARGYVGHGNTTTDTQNLDSDFMVQGNAKVEDEHAYNSEFNQIIIADENVVNNPKSTIQDIKKYVSWYPHLDEGFRLLQIQNPLFFSFHDFLAFHHFLADPENINNNEMPDFDMIIQDAENLIAAGIKDAFFSRELKFATKCIYNNSNDDLFNEIFSELSIQDEQDKDKSAFDRAWFFQIQTIRFVMKHRHTFMKNILKSWFDQEFTMLHQEYYNLIYKKFQPYDSDDELEVSHFGNMISTNITHDNSCMLKFIIQIDPNYLQFKDKKGNGLLHYAVEKNALLCAQLLIDQQININLQNNYGATPLFCAVKKDNIELTRLLINAGANQYSFPHGTLEIASTAGYEDIVDILIHAGPTNHPSYSDFAF